ncbi:hypothetical protein BV22DRAFT_390650 [Leucogyrophana mollusca]|uniref:Uncharacterized protein n=1 Tax=Leucogyrophana mollusca TaxID=85980 RepID=A0ACB8BNA7_9AGAM|nr:hypothetical protein BV22DRAFT_390650 [Leucogyrophana mollusca]
MGTSNKDSVLTSISNGGEVPHRTVAEIAREKRLRDDPMAEVHGPLFVTCKRCGSRIKLSPKSSYDPFHWTKHRERCLKKPAGVVRAAKRESKEIYGPPQKKSPTLSSNTDGETNTPPPLTPDDDRRRNSDDTRAESPLLDFSESDIPLKTASDLPLVDHGHWQTWDWDQLRPPPWMVNDSLLVVDDDDDDDYDDYDSMPMPAYQAQARDPAPRLSLRPGPRT